MPKHRGIFSNLGSVQFPQDLQGSGLAHYFEMGIVLILIGVAHKPGLISGSIHLDQI